MKIFRRYFEEEKANLITLSFSPINRVEKLSISHKSLERKTGLEGKAWVRAKLGLALAKQERK